MVWWCYSAPPEGEPKVVAGVFMPLRSLPPNDSYPCSGACPTSSPPRSAIAPRPASAPICHRETRLRLAFFAGLPAAVVLEDYSFAGSASARSENHSSTASLRSRPLQSRRHRPASSLSTWPPLLSLCWWVPLSIRCDKNAPCTAATTLPDRTLPGSPPSLNTYRKQTAAHPSNHVLSGAAGTPSNSPCLPSILRPPPALREIPRRSHRSPPTAIRSALRHA